MRQAGPAKCVGSSLVYLLKSIAWHFTQSRSHANLYSCSTENPAALALSVERQEPISWEYNDNCAYTALQSACNRESSSHVVLGGASTRLQHLPRLQAPHNTTSRAPIVVRGCQAIQ